MEPIKRLQLLMLTNKSKLDSYGSLIEPPAFLLLALNDHNRLPAVVRINRIVQFVVNDLTLSCTTRIRTDHPNPAFPATITKKGMVSYMRLKRKPLVVLASVVGAILSFTGTAFAGNGVQIGR